MFDATMVLVNNLTEALTQATNYLTLGLATSVSAFAVDRGLVKPAAAGNVNVSWLPPGLEPETAKAFLLGLCWVAGAMAVYAIEAADRVAGLLASTPEALRAACAYPSLATAPLGYGLAAAVLPLAFVTPVMWRVHTSIRRALPGEDTFMLPLIFLIPYGAAITALWRLDC